MTEIKWRTDKEYLKKLVASADVSFFEANWAKNNGDLETYQDCLTHAQVIFCYFARLTLKALEDWELGEHLIKVYDEVKSKRFKGFFAGLERILDEQHEPQGRLIERNVKSLIGRWEDSNAIEMAPKYLDKWLEFKKNETRSSEDKDNAMFA